MKRLSKLQLSAVLLVASLFTSQAHAYGIITDNFGDPLKWNSGAVSWAMAANGSDDLTIDQVETALKNAVATWQNVSCAALNFTYQGKVNANPSGGIFIRFLEQNWDMTVQDALGVTTNWQLNPQGGAKKVEIFFNGVNYVWAVSGADDPFTNVNDIEAVAVHELGHAIGITHSRHRHASMWFTTFPGESEEARTLEPDDERAACFLYPQSAFSDGQLCDACFMHSHCQSGSCIDYGADGPHCGVGCGTGSPCPADYECYELQGGGTPQCIPTNQHCKNVGGNIPVGTFCYDHATCASGICLVLPDSAVCSQQCNPVTGTGCPTGMGCVGSESGICYPKGDVPIGGDCESPSDCETILCVGVGQAKGVCTSECASDAACPSGLSCVGGLCVEAGNKQFGETCETSLDCGSFYCPPFLGYCSDQCGSNADCPAGIECELGFGGTNGYCDAGATGQTGDTCGPQAKECVTGLFCFYSTAEATLGQCSETCDARYDNCSTNKFCEWIYQDWSQKVVGVCRTDNGGAGPGEPCGGSLACRPDLVCANTDGIAPACRHDCNSINTLGCPSGSSCIALSLPDDPKLGACHPKDGAPAVENPTVVETERTAEPPPETPSDDLGGATGGTSAGGTTNSGATGGTAGIDVTGDGTTTGSATGSGTGGSNNTSGGCSQAGTPGAPASGTAILLALVGLVTLRRRKGLWT